jgi:ketosteroid isomerase-like protein
LIPVYNPNAMKSIRLVSVSAFIVILTITISSCNNKKQIDDSKVLTDTDRFYSLLSAEKGMNASFLEMFDSAGVMLRANQQPIEGIESIRALLMSENDSSFILTWEPRFAKIAASGELGYTYGTYQIKDKATDSITGVGKYATIWIKQSDGKWKAILDTGNPGLGEAK